MAKDDKNVEDLEEQSEESEEEASPSEESELETKLKEKDAELRKAQFTIHKLKDEKKGEEGQEDLQSVVRKTLAEDYIDAALDELSEDDDERERIREIYSKRLNPSGFSRREVLDDLRAAQALANRNIDTEQERSKVEESHTSRTTGANSSQRKSQAAMPKLTPQEQKLVERYKLTPEQVREALSNSK